MPLIAVKGVSKIFGLRPALQNVSFDVEAGRSVVLLGPNGSGKTTLLRLLAALSTPTVGTITIGGWSLPGEADAVRAQLGVVAHLPLLYDDLTAQENLTFYAELYNADPRQAGEALARVGLAKRSQDLARTFSRGMQQRLAIARAMLHEPAVLLLDEPYTGLDPTGADLLDGLIAEWKAKGRTILTSMHDLDRASRIADQVLILNRGKVAVNASVADLDNLPAVFEAVTA